MSITKKFKHYACKVGAFLSAAVGNSPEEVKARHELGLDPFTREDAELGLPGDLPEQGCHRHHRFG